MSILNKHIGQRIVVIGDYMLDKYVFGDVARVSPESGCPILLKKETSYQLGGAANVAYQLAQLNKDVCSFGIVGNDAAGEKINELLNEEKVDVHLFAHDVTTTLKTRFVNALHLQMFRVDEEIKEPLNDYEAKEIMSYILSNKESIESVVLSDYNKGVLSKKFIKDIISLCNSLSLPTIVDIKVNERDKYHGATIIKGNFKEFYSFYPDAQISFNNLSFYMRKLKDEMQSEYLVITLGKYGLSFVEPNNSYTYIPADQVPVYDVTGAGDIITAYIAALYRLQDDFKEVLNKANKAANIKVGKFGNSKVSLIEVGVNSSKLKTVDELLELTKNKKIVFTNGCFDILHAGHVDMLNKAKELGDILVVGLNSDESIKKLKGNSRPINKNDMRVEVLSALQCVDYIVCFDDETPLKVIEALCPSVLVKGGDYEVNNIVGSDFVKRHNGRVITIPFKYFTSTTDILKGYV